MNITSLSLPHPVLGIGDDIKGKYDPGCDKEIFIDRIILRIKHELDNESLSKMIKNGEAVFGVEINCPQTIYREMFLSEKNLQEIIIDSDCLRDKVTINFFILASDKTDIYKPSSVNSEYGRKSFDISEGEVLGYGGSTFFYADKRWRESESVSSFMTIIKSDKKEGPIEYNLMSDRINICLPEKDYYDYKKPGNDFKQLYNVYHGALVYPALLYALIKIFNDNEDDSILKTYSWYDLLSDRLDNDSRFKGMDKTIENAPLVAQTLLSAKKEGTPITRTIKCINDVIESINENNEE